MCRALDKAGAVSKILNGFSLGVFFLMILITFVDVLLRYLFSSPLSGTKEYTEALLILLVSFAIPYTVCNNKHIRVELITERLSEKNRLFLKGITDALSTGLTFLMTYQCIHQLIYFITSGKLIGAVMRIPAYPFQLALTLGCAIMLLFCLKNTLETLCEFIKSGFRPLRYIGAAVTLAALAVLFWLWMQPGLWDIGKGALALIGVVFMLALLFTGFPTGFGLMLSGLIMIGHVRGTVTALDFLAMDLFSTAGNYTWAVVGFFMLMGCLCYHARFGEDIYGTVQKLLGWSKGGLAIVTIGASTALAGIVGDSTSVVSTMSSIAYPQMKKYGYDDRLSTGVIAAGSLIGPLIPPSTGFILFASLTGVSLGKLFVAGIIPGLTMAVLYILTIKILCWRDPRMGPRGPKSTPGEKIGSLKYGAPIILLFFLVIGGVYGGIFTANEGGAVGCAGALFIGLVMKRLGIKSFVAALSEAGSNLGMIFSIIIGATIFSRFLAWCNLSGILSDFFLGMNISPYGLVLAILAFFFIAGFFVDIIPMLLLGIPVCYPIVSAMGIDVIWFAVLLVVVIQTGVITPPFATILFAMKGMIPGIKIETIFAGVIPFVIATAATILVLYLFPPLITWLPAALA